jgi:hypothetical protein
MAKIESMEVIIRSILIRSIIVGLSVGGFIGRIWGGPQDLVLSMGLGAILGLIAGLALDNFAFRVFLARKQTIIGTAAILILLSGWLLWERRVVSERRAMLDWIQRHSSDGIKWANSFRRMDHSFVNPSASVSWMRIVLGDQSVAVFLLNDGMLTRQADGSLRFFPRLDSQKFAEIAELFPEAIWMVNDFEISMPSQPLGNWPDDGLQLRVSTP